MTDRQRDLFLQGEADEWYLRNREVLLKRDSDPVLDSLAHLKLQPTSVLEVGCANGWRLELLRQHTGASVAGVDPSSAAIEEGHALYPAVDLRVGTAEELDFGDASFDLVIFGFCLYLVDPQLLFRVVAEADRVLRDGGHVVIFDFLEPTAYHNEYVHRPGVRSHKMVFSRLFTAHPAYFLIHRQLDMTGSDALAPDRRSGVDVLVKDNAGAFPVSPHVRT